MVNKFGKANIEYINILYLNMLEVKCDGDCIFSQLSLVTNEVENSRKEECTS